VSLGHGIVTSTICNCPVQRRRHRQCQCQCSVESLEWRAASYLSVPVLAGWLCAVWLDVVCPVAGGLWLVRLNEFHGNTVLTTLCLFFAQVEWDGPDAADGVVSLTRSLFDPHLMCTAPLPCSLRSPPLQLQHPTFPLTYPGYAHYIILAYCSHHMFSDWR
jgi:hypothetical protein